MPSYRLYFLDANGHVRRRVDIECRDDDEAIEEARNRHVDHDIDLWCDSRRVKVLKTTA